MKSNPSPAPPQTFRSQPLVLACLAFVLGIALTGIWFHHHQAVSESGRLSASTKKMLGQLESPVTIRYYSLLPAGSADETLQAFAGRVAQLLNAVQTAGGGKVQLTSFDAPASADAASADGIQAFNLDKGDACFLGLAIASGNNKEAFARLQPEWEPALEYDLARAIQRVAAVAAPAKPPPEVARPSPGTIATINRLIPDVNAVTAEQAGQIFHSEYLKQCGEVGAEAEARIKAAQQQLAGAQAGGSEADIQAARKNVLEVQLAQGEKLKDLAAQLQIQLAVFQRMKSGATNDAK
ncbi:MAG: Gldg family protein [Verrucomicrobiales bacterium]|nr:Gldg family protein [Verrucomicrobiales bacterium]